MLHLTDNTIGLMHPNKVKVSIELSYSDLNIFRRSLLFTDLLKFLDQKCKHPTSLLLDGNDEIIRESRAGLREMFFKQIIMLYEKSKNAKTEELILLSDAMKNLIVAMKGL